MEHPLTNVVIMLDKIPLPPSENRLFINVPKRPNLRGRIKSKEYRDYIAAFQIWVLKERLILKIAQKLLVTPTPLQVSFTMYFRREALFCKDGSIKRMDIQNRLKAICDLLSEALGINDSSFFKVSIEKRVGTEEVKAQIKLLEISPELS